MKAAARLETNTATKTSLNNFPNHADPKTNERGQKTKVRKCRLDCPSHARLGGGVADVHAAQRTEPGQQRPARRRSCDPRRVLEGTSCLVSSGLSIQ